jgi:hypothetical protein
MQRIHFSGDGPAATPQRRLQRVFSVITHFSGGGRTGIFCDYPLQRRLGGRLAASVLCDSSLQRRFSGGPRQRVFSVVTHFSDGPAACSDCSL